MTTDPRPIVGVVDDDESLRESMPTLLRVLGYRSRVFSSAGEFLAADGATNCDCLILDVAMPGMSGPELFAELSRRDVNVPAIFVTAHRDDALGPRLMAQGAVGLLYKPFSDTALASALGAALRGE